MSKEITVEKDEVGITLDGKHYLCHLEADLEVETTGYDPEVEAPSFLSLIHISEPTRPY